MFCESFFGVFPSCTWSNRNGFSHFYVNKKDDKVSVDPFRPEKSSWTLLNNISVDNNKTADSGPEIEIERGEMKYLGRVKAL